MFTRFKINRLSKKLKAMQHSRNHNPNISPEVKKREVESFNKLAKLYQSVMGKKKFPYAYSLMVESYRGAANLNDPESLFTLAKLLIEEGKVRDGLQKDSALASEANERLKNICFSDGHHYLRAADEYGHILAKRFRGLCIINGWGIEANRDQGFDMIVTSIDLEKSWDKVPQIFASMGLNKPEFFAALSQHRSKH